MSQKKYLDYTGLQELVAKIKEKYASIEAIVFKGTVADVEHLPAVADQKVGYMYNVATGGGTTSDFVVGPGHVLRDGDNVTAVNVAAEGDPVELKWDILGAVFVIEDRLQFGMTMPASPVDEQIFLYMGDTTYKDVYTLVSNPDPDSNPSTEGWFEYDGSTTYSPSADDHLISGKTYYTVTADSSVQPSLDPAGEGYYESDGAGGYVVTADTSVDVGKTYYLITALAAEPHRGDDPSDLGWYKEDGAGGYITAVETYVVSGVDYYTKTQEEEFVTGVIYKYDATAGEWNSQTAGDTYIPITNAEVDALFD